MPPFVDPGPGHDPFRVAAEPGQIGVRHHLGRDGRADAGEAKSDCPTES
jgi:hypothetical protein